MARHFKLAVLECDTPIPNILERYGTYGDIFKRLLDSRLPSLKPETSLSFEFSKWDVVDKQEYPNLRDVDAFLLTGSRHDSFGNDAWIVRLVEIVRQAMEARVPVVGICFGHQIIARALGADVGRNHDGWEIAVDQVQLTDRGQELFGQKSLSLHQMHRDIVFDVPDGLEILGSSPRCRVQGLYAAKRLLSVQAHPEFDEFVMSEILALRHEQGVFDDEMYQEGLARAPLHHDGKIVGTAICKFLLT